LPSRSPRERVLATSFLRRDLTKCAERSEYDHSPMKIARIFLVTQVHKVTQGEVVRPSESLELLPDKSGYRLGVLNQVAPARPR
jgi:hypothetical protein